MGLKSLLPIIGGVAGFFGGPAASAAVNAALGSGIGTLLAGGDVKDAIKNAALSGLAGSGATAAGFGPEAAAKATAKAAAEKKVLESAAAEAATEALGKQVAEKGIGSKLLDFLKTPTGMLTGGGLAALLAGEEEDENELTELQKRQLATGERVPDYIGRNIVQEFDYPLAAAEGGYIQGPGTGRSDSINAGIFQNGRKVQEARLSDGEFVMTERAVRGMGDGDREKGAARMYEIMKKYERVA